MITYLKFELSKTMTRRKFILAAAGRPFRVVADALSLGVGAVGLALPMLPMTNFVILAAFCLARGSPGLARVLKRHRIFGPMIVDWRNEGAIAPCYKLIAHLMMGTALAISLLARLPISLLTIQALCITACRQKPETPHIILRVEFFDFRQR